MKINNLAKKITAAFALLMTVSLAQAATNGDIYSIDLVTRDGGTIPTASKPLVAGERAVVRVRMINRDYATSGKDWFFKPVDSWASLGSTNILESIYAPAFGFVLGGDRVAYAEYLATDPVTSPANTYTDIFFLYTVQPGDLAMPATFKLKPGDSGEYYLRNSNIWNLTNEDKATVNFALADQSVVESASGVENTNGKPSDQPNRMADTTGVKLGLFVKSVDFDENYVDAKNKIWRKIGLNDTETSNGVQPTITVTGGDLQSAVTMYVWVDDETVAEPENAESYTNQTVGITRKILSVTIDAGKTSQSFKLYGKSLGTANVCMSSSKDFTFQKGTYTIVTNWVTRTIGVVTLDPSVSLTFKDTGGTATSDLRCSTDYTQPIATLEVRLSTSPTNDVEVAINPTHDVEAVSVITNNLRFAESSNALEQPWNTPVSTVKFDASTSDLTKTLFVYSLGSTTNLENEAATFTPSVKGSDQYTKKNHCTVTLRRAKPTVAASKSSIDDAVLGEDYNLDITVGGSYDDLKGAGKDKWIFHYKVKSGTKYGSEYVTTNTVTVTGSEITGKFTAKIDKESLKLSATALDMWVTSPSGMVSDTVTVPLTVEPGLEAWARFGSAGGSPLGTYGEGDTTADIYFSISSDESKTVWAFLKPEEDSITNKMTCSAFTTLGTESTGVAIDKGRTNSLLSAKITLLDGDISGNFTVAICSTNVYNSTKVLKYVGDSVLTVVATNVVPRVTKAKQGSYSAANGGTLSGSVPLHIDREFKVDVFEPSKTDRDGKDNSGTPGGKDERFLTQWRFDDDTSCSDIRYGNNGEGWYTIYGDPASTNIHHTFHTPGTHTVTVRCRDKDMGSSVYGEEFTFNVVVEDEPVVVIKPVSGGSTYYEDMSGSDESTFSVSLVGAPYITSNEVLKVKIEVEKLGSSAYSTNDVVLSTNMVTFASGKVGAGTDKDALRTFYFKELNGTAGSAAEGFLIKATVMNAAADADGKTWGVGTYNVYIRNRNPVIISPDAEDQVDPEGNPIINNTNIGDLITIPWTVNDVLADRTNLTVTCTTSEGKTITTNTAAGVSGKLTTSFGEAGEKKTIKITVTDPDLGSTSVTLYYSIAASKVLNIIANGPSDGDSSIMLSTRYSRAKGHGEGRVFVSTNDATIARVEDFNFFWNCGLRSKVYAYGYGYLDGDVDNGWLTKDGEIGDQALSSAGANADKSSLATTATGYYAYSPDDHRSSYFYGWLKANEPGGTDYSVSPSPEVRGIKNGQPYPTGRSTRGSIDLPQDLTEDDAGYALTYAEAIFAKELLREDNVGDINSDGIPDYFATYDYANGRLATPDGQGGELVSVDSANDDGDYMPTASQLGKSTLIPGAVSGWATKGLPFSAYYELRGYHEGLNLGMFKPGEIDSKYGWVSEVSLSDNEKRSLILHALNRRDQILNEYRNNNWEGDDYRAGDWVAITNLLANTIRKGTSQHYSSKVPAMPAYLTDFANDYMNGTFKFEMTLTNEYTEVTNRVTGLVDHIITNQYHFITYTPISGTTNDTVVITNAINPSVDGLTITNAAVLAFYTPNPFDNLTIDDINYSELLNREYSNYAAQQTAITNYIERTWAGYPEKRSTWGWTCENRTDPTTDDTDGDGMPDGYEYFLWYDAMVGTDGTNHLVGCRFNLKDIESRDDVITSKEIASIYNPNVKHAWTSADTDNDGVTDLEEFLIGTSPVDWDTDRDGLSDLYELMYNINPLDAQASQSGVMNGDGDYMAYIKVDPVASTNNMALAALSRCTYVYTATNGTLWMLDTDYVSHLQSIVDTVPAVETIIGSGFEVKKFCDNYIPVTERTGNLTPLAMAIEVDPRVPVVTNTTVSLYHHQVHNFFGFDPRTGWYKDALGECSGRFGDVAGSAENTTAFTAKSEYALLKYRYIVGLRSYDDDMKNLREGKTSIQSILLSGTTNPNGTFENKTWGDSETVYRQTRHGADTDGDAVPDGWELYIGVNPNIDYRILKGSPGYDILFWDGNSVWPNIGDNDAYSDGLSFATEFAGTDTCGAYSDCPTIYANHPDNDDSAIKGWINKYMPTDPRNKDTDGDGLDDGKEGSNWTGSYTINRWGQDNNRSKETTTISGVAHHMIYGNPKSGGGTCVRGGGYNPCSIDSDSDGLPDLWEHQYTGLLFLNDEIATEDNSGEGVYVFPPLEGLPNAAIYDDIRAAVSALGWDRSIYTNDVYHIIMGMDGTSPDAYTGTGTKDHDRDWDGDGLQNWQEYMVQALRHLRYDDDKTPLMGRDISAFNTSTGESDLGAWLGTNGFLRLSYSTAIEASQYKALEELGYDNFLDYIKNSSNYLRRLGYFAPPPKDWDQAKGKLYMLPPYCTKVFAGLPRNVLTPFTDDSGNLIWGYVWDDTDGGYIDHADYPSGWLTITNATLPIATYVTGTSYTDGTVLWYTNETHDCYIVIEMDPTLGEQRWEILPIMDASVVYSPTNIPLVATKYVGTDPRLWDTDEDGMDDYYEIFHGLNPILGDIGTLKTSVAVSNELMEVSISTVSGAKDIISDAYSTSVNAWQNGWTGWSNKERPEYDPIRYPWMMGDGTCDADGDGLRNEEEALAANLTPPLTYHTDPTPLWMTDTTGSFTNYAGTITVTQVTTNGNQSVGRKDPSGASSSKTSTLSIVTNIVTRTTGSVALMGSPSYAGLFYHNFLSDNTDGIGTASAFSIIGDEYLFSFEQNEGYDTDNDWRSDSIEMKNTTEGTSDPLDSDDVVRRQSLWFGGASKKGAAISYEPTNRRSNGHDFFRQFTVEAWVRSENPVSGIDQYVVSRASYYPGWDADHTNAVIRMNFALGIDSAGRAFGEMQDSTETTFRLEAGNMTSNEWTHLAATYDGKTFAVYVNGDQFATQPTDLIPANGVTGVEQDPQYSGAFPYETYTYDVEPSITILGARANGSAAFDVKSAGKATGWTDIATNFFKGSVSEVRIWDGARSVSDIAGSYRERFTLSKIKELRNSVYKQYRSGSRRYDGSLKPELVQHYGLSSLPGATEEKYLQLVPPGFETNVLGVVRNPATGATTTSLQDALKVGWWSEIVGNTAIGSVYKSEHVVPWIENTVGHLPLLSGSIADSVYWSENFAGYTPAAFHELEKFSFRNTMNPYGVVVTHNEDRYADQKYHKLMSYYGGGMTYDDNRQIYNQHRYDARMGFTGTTDLVPLGSAFAKRLTESWDGQGAESPWAVTTDGKGQLDGDPNDTGKPDWASTYTSSLEYLRALARGLLPDGGTGTIKGEYANTEDIDTDGMPDWWEKYYSVYSAGPDDDTDRDGLSNYQEYLISEFYTNLVPHIELNPNSAYSSAGQAVPDYFLRHNKLYYGELFADHDHIEDWWEDGQPSVTTRGGTVLANYSRFVYDANTDVLGNGWDNWSLARAWLDGAYTTNIVSTTTDPDTGKSVVVTNKMMSSTLVENDGTPSPEIPIRVTYHGKLGNLGNKDTKYQIVIKAWGMENGNDPYMLGSPDKTWGMSVPSQNTLDVEGTAVGFSAEGGAIRPGRNMFVAYVAEGEFEEGTPAPAYEPGMPYGVASGVVVGPLSGANVNIEMTDVNYAMPRIDIGKAIKIQDKYAETVGGGDADRQACFNEMSMECTDRGRWARELLAAVNPYVGTDMHGAASNEVKQVMVRVVRSGINDEFAVSDLTLCATNAVITRVFPLATHNVLSEADLLADPDLGYDIDWGGPRKVFLEHNLSWPDITNAYYRIVLFDGTIKTDEDNNNLCVMFVNRFEYGKSQTAVTNMEVRTYSGQPTFSWQHPNTIDKAYPAFQLRVWDGSACVFDSGVQRAPVRDAAGRYNWTAPLWVGSITSSNKVFEANKAYTWSVSMLDAKFIKPDTAKESKSEFKMQETSPSGGSSDYGIIPVTVKYLGPGTVNIATNYTQCLRVEAYSSPDFIGMPSGVGFVYDDTDLSSTNKNSVNAMVYGLPADTPYYVRAYIDTNGNGALDAWESWGYACYRGSSDRSDFFTPRAVKAANADKVDDCTIYVEDADTNHNMVPDILEKEATGTFTSKMLSPYIAYGKHNEAAKIAAVDDAGVGTNGNAKTVRAAPRKLFAYATALNAVSSGYVTPGLYAVATGDVTVETEDSAHIKITSFSLDEGVTLEVVVDSDFADAIEEGFDTGYIKVGVEYATTLADGGDWKSVGTPDTISFPLTAGTTEVKADSLSGVKTAIESVKKTQSGSCYFRVSVVAIESTSI